MNHQTLLARMRTLIATPSVTCTDPAMDQGNLAVIEHLASWAETLGFRCEIMPVAPGKANLIATLGEGPGGLVFAGHTDTVPFDGAKWQSDPFTLTERDGRLFGLGTADMKGFFPLVLEAAEAAVAAVKRGETLRAPVIILATCDEETSMAGAKALVAAGKPKARFAVIGEPTSGRPLRLQKGVMMERVIIEGRSGHSSDPSLGHSALDAMHAVISELIHYRRELAAKWHNPLFTVPAPTLNLGCIHGGDNPNRICARCELQYDLRPLPGMEMDSLRTDIKRRLMPLAEEYQVSIRNESLFSGTPAMETPASSLLVKAVEDMTGFTAGAAAFGTEAPYFQELGMEAVIFGPGGIETAHQPDEHLEIASLQPTIEKLAELVRRFCL